MAQNIQINLKFNADTAGAKSALQGLQTQLNSVLTKTSTGNLGKGISDEIMKGQEAAMQLQAALKTATTATGKLDLTQFRTSLQNAGISVQQLRNNLAGLGPEGARIFQSMAASVATAEAPLMRTSTLVRKLGQTLATTAKWQLSSTMLMAFTSTIRDAFQYAEDLNHSLNDIRIVTGYSVDKMKEFSKEANKAARALSTTTNEYAKASLIYYQQGLSDKEVKARTDITIKMANVTGESAQQVSSYMTGIWNNFAEGSEKLDSFADKLTALGAATASSTEEIAEGLEKFAAVANTVGLSYDYATAALATVVAQTRQSADIVGTAFKTIFARLESLSLGESLDDDTTLTKYSQALATIGVSIKDQNGVLKDMDVILDEVGQKWQQIDRDQQVALAQTVAGMRQYNNFIALMDNYKTFKLNVDIATEAEGTLQEQADTYAESWEAAKNRVKAAAEEIYGSLLKDDTFIDLFDGFAKFLDLFGRFIDSAGGLGGILSMLGAGLLHAFSGEAAQGLQRMVTNMASFMGFAQTANKTFAQQVNESMKGFTLGSGNEAETAALQRSFESRAQYESKFLGIKEKLNAEEQLFIQLQREAVELADQQAQVAARELDTARNELHTKQQAMALKTKGENLETANTDLEKKLQDPMLDLADARKAYNKTVGFELSDEEWNTTLAGMQKIEAATVKNTAATKNYQGQVQQLEGQLNKFANKAPTWADATVAVAQAGLSIVSAINMINNSIDTLKDPDASGWEKFSSIVMSLSMGIIMLKSSMSALSPILNKQTLQNWANALSEKAKAKATRDAANAKRESAVSTDAASKETNEDTASNIANAASEKTKNSFTTGTDKRGRTFYKQNGKFISKSTYEAGTTSKAASTGSTVAGAGTTAGTGSGAGAGAAAGIGGAIAAIAVIAAVVAAIAALAVISSNIYNRAENEAKSAEATAQQMQEYADEQKAIYDETKNAISNYKSLSEEIDKLTKGTTEWKDKTFEANEEAMKLLETYDTLSYTMKNGRIVIDEDELAEAQAEQLRKVSESQSTATIAEMTARQARGEADLIKFQRENLRGTGNDVGTGIGNTLMSTGVGAGAGAAIGSVVPVIGTAIGAVVGAIAGLITGIVGSSVAGASSSAEEKAIAALRERYKTDPAIFANDANLRKALEELKITDQGLIDSLVANREATKELVETLNSNDLKDQLAREKIFIQENQDNEQFANSKYQEAIAALGAKSLDKDSAKYKAIEAEIEELWSGGNQDFWDKYLSEMYGDQASNYRIEDQGGSAVTLQKRNAEGAWETIGDEDGLDEDIAQQNLVLKMVAKSTGNSINDLETKVRDYEQQLFAAGIDTSTNLVTQIANYSRGEAMDLTSLTWSELDALDPNQIANAGLADAVAKAQANAKNSWNNTINSYSTSVTKALNDLTLGSSELVDNVNRAQLEAYGNTLERIRLAGGEAASDKFASSITRLLKENSEYSTQIIQAASGVDWTRGEQALAEFNGLLYDAGLNIDENTKIWQEFAQVVEKTKPSILTRDLETIKENLKSISKLASGLEFGGIINEEDYNTLTKYNGALKKSFMLTSEGYRFVGNTNEAKKETLDLIAQELETQLELNSLTRSGAEYLKKESNLNSLAAGTASIDTLIAESTNLLNSKAGQDALSAAGISKEEFDKDVQASVDDEEARKRATEYWKKLQGVYEKALSGEADDRIIYELTASQYTNISDLEKNRALFANDTSGAYEKQLDYLKEASKEFAQQISVEGKLTNEIEKQLAAVEKIAHLRENAYGDQYLALAQQEAAALEATAQFASQQAALEKVYLQNDIRKLATEYGIDNEVTIDENGFTNIQGIIYELVTTEGLTEDDARIKALQAVEERAGTIRDYENDFVDYVDQALETRLEGIQHVVNIQIDEAELKAKWDDSLLNWVKDNPFTQAEVINDYINDFTRLNNELTIQAGGLNQMAAEHLGYSLEEAEAMGLSQKAYWQLAAKSSATIQNALSTYQNKQIEVMESAHEITQNITDEITRFFEDVAAEYDNVRDQINQIIKLVENYTNIVDIIGKKNLGINNSLLKGMNDAIITAKRGLVETAKSELDTTESLIKDLRTALSTGATDALVETYGEEYANMTTEQLEKALEEQEKRLPELANNVQSTLADALSAVVDAYSQELSFAVEEFEKAISGTAGSLEELSKAFKQQSTLNDQYLADYEKIYELSKLRRSVEQSIDSSSNVKSQRVLRDLVNEITSLEKSGVKVSEYQLEMLQKKYELKLAEQALEDSKGSSRQMTLRRNAEGGWSYEYTNAEQELNTMQGYEDALYNLTETNQTYITQLESDLISVQQNLVNDLMSIANDMTLSVTEKQIKMDSLMSYYNERLAYYEEQLGITFEDANQLYNYDLAGYTTAINFKEGLTTKWADTISGVLLGDSNSVSAYFQELRTNISNFVNGAGSDSISSIMTACFGNQPTSTINQVLNDAGLSLTTFGENFAAVVNGETSEDGTVTVGLAEQVAQALDGIEGDEWATPLGKLKGAVETWVSDINTIVSPLKETFEGILGLATNSALGEASMTIAENKTKMEDITNYEVPQGAPKGLESAYDTLKTKVNTAQADMVTKAGNLATAESALSTAKSALAANPNDQALQENVATAQAAYDTAKAEYDSSASAYTSAVNTAYNAIDTINSGANILTDSDQVKNINSWIEKYGTGSVNWWEQQGKSFQDQRVSAEAQFASDIASGVSQSDALATLNASLSQISTQVDRARERSGNTKYIQDRVMYQDENGQYKFASISGVIWNKNKQDYEYSLYGGGTLDIDTKILQQANHTTKVGWGEVGGYLTGENKTHYDSTLWVQEFNDLFKGRWINPAKGLQIYKKGSNGDIVSGDGLLYFEDSSQIAQKTKDDIGILEGNVPYVRLTKDGKEYWVSWADLQGAIMTGNYSTAEQARGAAFAKHRTDGLEVGSKITIKPEWGKGHSNINALPESGGYAKAWASDLYNTSIDDVKYFPGKGWAVSPADRNSTNEEWWYEDYYIKKADGDPKNDILYADPDVKKHTIAVPKSGSDVELNEDEKSTELTSYKSSAGQPYGFLLGHGYRGSTEWLALPDSTRASSGKRMFVRKSLLTSGGYWSGRSFDTGGYTGAWGPEGRLAMLHQKEIVLNAADTKNLLSAVDIIRQIAQVIDLQATAAAHGIGNLSFNSPQNTSQTLQQEVTIHAEFPNATDHNEIEEAFNQLINHTSQFIHRN